LNSQVEKSPDAFAGVAFRLTPERWIRAWRPKETATQLADSEWFAQRGQRVLWRPFSQRVFWLLFWQQAFSRQASWQQLSWLPLFWRQAFWQQQAFSRLLF